MRTLCPAEDGRMLHSATKSGSFAGDVACSKVTFERRHHRPDVAYTLSRGIGRALVSHLGFIGLGAVELLASGAVCKVVAWCFRR